MRLKSATSFALVISLLFPVALFAANPKAGAKCPKAGQSQVFSGKKFTCIKSGKNLVWNKGVELPKPTATPTPLPSPKGNQGNTEIKAGDQCTSAERGTTKSTNAGIYICKHDDVSAYRWFVFDSATPSNTPTTTPAPTQNTIDWTKTFSTDDGFFNFFNGPCQYETNVEPQWRDLQEVHNSTRKCSGIYSLAKYKLGNARPVNISNVTTALQIEQCKISESNNSMALRGFYSKWESSRIAWTNKRKFPSSKMNIQVIPIYAEDTAAPSNSPEEDYGKYLKFFKEWVEYSSDVSTDINVKFPSKYIKFQGKVSDYNIYHENRFDSPGHVKFNKDLISQVDSQIDFTGIDVAFIVVPAGTKLNVFQQGTIGELVTNEGSVFVSTTEYPNTLSDLNSVKFANFLVPFWWVHEFFHSAIGFTDHYGDDQHNVNTEYGLGWWTLMTPWGGDLSAWEKWILGFYDDSQINCLAPNSTNTVWIAPSSVETNEKKLTIIPVSEFKAIAIESIRPAGLYYKIPKESNGVLVYEIDLTNLNHDQGLKLVLPTNRNPNQGPFFLAQGTLRVGESVISNGQRITIIESGTFGDVIKVEKA